MQKAQMYRVRKWKYRTSVALKFHGGCDQEDKVSKRAPQGNDNKKKAEERWHGCIISLGIANW